MMKITIKLFLIYVIAFTSATCFSFTRAIAANHIDSILFYQLPHEDQKSLIKSAHMFLADYEQLYIDDLNRKKLKEKYSAIENLFNHLIQQAHADSIGDLIFKGSTNICVYAGWISYVKETNSSVRCKHPLAVDLSNTNEISPESIEFKSIHKTQKKYAQLNGLKLDENGMIERDNNGNPIRDTSKTQNCPYRSDSKNVMVCNPSIFGTKMGDDGNPDANKPFCSYGNTNPYNSSWGCVKAINEYVNENKDKIDDLENKIYKGIIDNALQEKADNESTNHLSSLMQMIYDACMCKGKGSLMNKTYASKMYERRTCYAWLYQSKNILERAKSTGGACYDLSGIPYQNSDGKQIASLSDWAGKAYEYINSELNDSGIQDPFTLFDTSNESDPPEWRQRPEESNCPITFDGDFELTKTKEQDKDIYVVKIELKTGFPISQKDDFKFNLQEEVINEKVDPITIKVKQLDQLYKIKVTHDIFGEKEIEIPPITKQITCSISQSPEDPENADNKNTLLKLTADGIDFSDENVLKNYQIDWTENVKLKEGSSTEAIFSTNTDKLVKVTIEDITNKNKIECSVEIKAPEDDQGLKIKIKENNDKGDHNILSAKITKDGADITLSDGLSVSWTTSYSETSSTTANAEDAGMDSDNNDNSTSEKIASDKLDNIKVAKKSVKQVITAVLKKDGKEISKDSENVAALEESDETKDKDKENKKKAPMGLGQDIPLKNFAPMPGQRPGMPGFSRGVK